ncbi:prepilin peptidase [Plantactinospora siamensis]|uniref:Prepilin peptidase n=1 Tax=Plantactinospora siamensis TaxID=555372 RepID=A0ABV6NQF9_9ACTN
MLLAVVVAAALAGAGWGVLVSGLVHRYAVEWPAGAPRPEWRTGCAYCGAERGPWWRAAGRCPGCGRRPRPGRWLTVPLSAAACGGVAAAVGPVAALPAYLLFAALAVPLALVDLAVLRLPDPLVGTVAAGGLALLGLAALVDGAGWPLLRALGAAAACGVGYLTIALVPRSGLGFGDVKLGATIGLLLGWLGWFPVVAGVALAPLLNLPLVVGLLVTGRAGRKTSVPFGPALLAGTFAAMIIAALR